MLQHTRKMGIRSVRRAGAIVAGVAVVLIGSAFGAASSAAVESPLGHPASSTTSSTTASAITRTSASSVSAAYLSRYLPAMSDTVGWTGTINPCDAGTTSAQSLQYSQSAINFDRALAGLDPVTLDPTLNSRAQAAALVMAANQSLSHAVPDSWACASKTAQTAAASSDLYLGDAGAHAVGGYMVDPGTGNTAVGHRRWILYPSAMTMGTGSAQPQGSLAPSNALYVFGARATAGHYVNPRFVRWPSANYFPSQLEPNGRWSLSGAIGHTWNFAAAKVHVTNSKGQLLPVSISKPVSGYGADTLVFTVGHLVLPAVGGEIHYRVSMNGILLDGKKISTFYIVKFIHPSN